MRLETRGAPLREQGGAYAPRPGKSRAGTFSPSRSAVTDRELRGDPPIVIVVAVLGGIFGYIEIIRQRTVQLSATNLEFQTTTGGFYRSRTAIPRANIESLEYREESGGPDHYEPAGLYAGLRAGARCVLPYLDQRQTQTVIEAIYRRFPDMPIAERETKSSLDKHFTTLGI